MERSVDAKQAHAEIATPLHDPAPVEPDDDLVDSGARRFAVLLGFVVVIALAAIGVYQGRSGTSDRGVHAGEAAPLFALPSFNLQPVALESFRGRPVVLNFWASWCAPCRTEAPVLAKTAFAQGDRVAFIGINVRDQEKDAQAFIAEFHVPYTNLRDLDGTVEPLYDSVGIPFTVFISSDGVIKRTFIGPLDEPHLLAFIAELD